MHTRRTFIGYTAASAVSIFGPSALAGQPAHGSPAQSSESNNAAAGWYSKPMRWAQIGFAEDDPGNYDPKFWLNYFEACHIDAVTLNAGGAVAFYPTEVPLHYRSRWLGSMDTFGDLMKSCKARGMVVVARTDAHACHNDVRDKHPDWIAVDENGKKRRHPSDPDFWITCALGGYNFEFMTAVHKEIATRYAIDGIFTNRWAGSGMCWCESCRTQFRAFSGMELPRSRDAQDPARQRYIVWHQQRLFELWKLWNQTIQAIRPGASYIANAGGGTLSDLDMKTIGDLAPTLFADRQARTGLMAPWANGKNGKEYRATMGKKAIVGIFSMGLEEKWRWKDSVTTGDEIRMWVVDGMAQGLRPWFTKFDCKVIDERWMPVVQELYQWQAAHEAYLRNDRPLARVGMVYSQQTALYYAGDDARGKVEDPGLGFYQALIEARIPFEMVHDHLLDPEHIKQFRTLILPNIAALSNAQCLQLQTFVANGGSLVATFETSLYDEWGKRRSDFGLRELFGVSYAGKTQSAMMNSYLALNRDKTTGQYHPLLNDLQDAHRIINGVNQVVVTPEGRADYPLQVIPSYPDLPMEEVFPRGGTPQGQVGAVARTVGKGRVVYLPSDVDRTFWDNLNYDHGRLLRNAVLWATNEPAPLQVQGKGVIDVALWMQQHSMTAHLVNLTNPMMLKGPVREIIPIGAQQVRIAIPPGVTVKAVKLLVAGTSPHFINQNSTVELTIPTIALNEVVAIDLA